MRYLLILVALITSTAFATPSIEETMIEAMQGEAYAQYNLGLIYFKGEGVPKNDAEAVKWFRKAADQGHAKAQFNQGLMYVTPDISDSYVPQMLNLQATGAIDFKKGCYTGQEIVARMQYLGKLKRHLFIGQVNSNQALQVGQQIDASKRKNVGRITSTAANGAGTYTFTAVINRTEAQEEQLHLHEQDNTVIALSPLPYEIDPQVFERIKL